MTDEKKPDTEKQTTAKKEAGAKSPAPASAEKKETDAKPTEPVTEQKKPRKKRHRTKPASSHLAKLALLSSLVIAGGIFYLWQENRKELDGLQQQLSELNAGVTETMDNQSQLGQAVRGEIGTLYERQQALLESLDELLRSNRHLKHEWLVAEAQYLVNMAGEQLTLARDVNTALAALRAADARLHDAGDPSLIPVRKALADDINALEAVNQPDITGMSLKLSALVKDTGSLPLLTPEPESAERQIEAQATSQVENWEELPSAVWKDIKKLIIIRDHQGPIKPLLSPQQHFFLNQNLKLQLEQARLALLNVENGVYQERLATVEDWLKTWFDISDDRTNHMLSVIQELGSVDINPPLPDLSGSYQALQNYRNVQSQPVIEPEANPSASDTTSLQVPL